MASVSPLVAALAALLLLLIVPPVVYLVTASLHETNYDGSFGEFTLGNYAELVSDVRFLQVAWTTFLYSLGSAGLAMVFGGIQAWIVERTNTPFRHAAFALSIISLAIPSALYTISLLLLLGKTGPINQLLAALTGANGPVFNVYSLWGMILIEGIEFTPLSFLLLSSNLRNSDAALEEAALMSGAGIWATLTRVTFPLTLPGLLALLLLIFIRALESFETPALVGRPGRVDVITSDVFQSMLAVPPAYGQAGAFSVVLLLIVALLLMLYGRLALNAGRYRTISGKGYRPRVLDLGQWRFVTLVVLALIFLITIGLPMLILLWVSLQPFYAGISTEALSLVTLKHYDRVVTGSALWDAAANTLTLGAATSLAIVPVTALCAWLAVRRRPGAWLLDQLASAPLVFPAIVLGAAMLELVLNVPVPLYGTLTSIIIACSIQYMPYGMRYAYAGALQIDKEIEEAAQISGASGTVVFRRIVLPLLTPALIAGALFVFLMTVKAVSIPILLSGPRSRVVAVTLFDMWQNGLIGELSALGVLWTGFMMLFSLGYFVLVRHTQFGVR
jgi:iron(III) transport system permease protein